MIFLLFSINRVRIKDDNSEENMADVCVGHDIELEHKQKRKTTLPHCTVTVSGQGERTIIILNIRRARKYENDVTKTISDFRKYQCKVNKENQAGYANVQLVGT